MRAESGSRSLTECTSGIVAVAVLTLLAHLIHRRPRSGLRCALVAAVVAGAFGATTPKHLSSSDDDFQDKSAESWRTLQLLSREPGVVPGPSIGVVAPPGAVARDVAILRRDPGIPLVRPKGRVIGAYLRRGASDAGPRGPPTP